MKQIFICAVLAAIFFINVDIFCFGKKTIFGIRSQGLDGVRELTGWQQLIYKYDQESNYGTVAAILEYSSSFKPDNISKFLFGADKLRFSGSQAERQKGDILADYFGLPVDFSSTVLFSPHISNTIVDFNWFQAFDGSVPGLFIMMHVPIVHTKWNLSFEEIDINPGTAFYPAGYMGRARINASNLPHTVRRAMRGNTAYGDMDQPLKYGKIFGRQTSNRVAEIQGSIGWNYNQPWYHVGFSFRVGAPTGNATTAEFLFEEIVGNRHHWDIGGGFSGHVVCWHNDKSGRKVAVYADAHLSHLCTSQQKRSFDFTKNGPGSRYVLLEQMQDKAIDLLINGETPTKQYMGNLVQAINYTTFNTKISIAVQADIVFKLAYQRDGFELDLGYNFWINSKEKMHSRDIFPADTFALKGDAQIYGFNVVDLPVALNATQSMTTILGGQGVENKNYVNLNADNQPALARIAADILNQLNHADSLALNIPEQQVHGSNPSIMLSDADINNDSGILPRALSHKIFGYIGKIWNNKDDIDPYLGLGLSSEFAHTDVNNNAMCPQWAVWIKAGLSY